MNGFHAIGPDRVWNWAWKLTLELADLEMFHFISSDRLFFDPRGMAMGGKEEELEEVRKQAQYIEPLDTWILVDWRWSTDSEPQIEMFQVLRLLK